MTISILKLEAGQKVARPFSRACSRPEMHQMLIYWSVMNNERRAAQAVHFHNIDSEFPVMTLGTTKFFAFTEE